MQIQLTRNVRLRGITLPKGTVYDLLKTDESGYIVKHPSPGLAHLDNVYCAIPVRSAKVI